MSQRATNPAALLNRMGTREHMLLLNWLTCWGYTADEIREQAQLRLSDGRIRPDEVLQLAQTGIRLLPWDDL